MGLDLTDATERKATPVYSGVFQYFPKALAAVNAQNEPSYGDFLDTLESIRNKDVRMLCAEFLELCGVKAPGWGWHDLRESLYEIAQLSWIGNEQHNPGEPLHWARGKSMDQEDCFVRHYLDAGKNFDLIDIDGVKHITKAKWRLLAIIELELERQINEQCDRREAP